MKRRQLLVFAAGCAALTGGALLVWRHQKRLTPHGTWPPSGYAKVIGYRFAGGGSGGPFSLIPGSGTLNLPELDRLTVKSVTLDEGQVRGLLNATFSQKPEKKSSACYNPHHIFLFCDQDGAVLNAIEICFECDNSRLAPGSTAPGHPDYRSLARLCQTLSLWDEGSWSVEQYEETHFYDTPR